MARFWTARRTRLAGGRDGYDLSAEIALRWPELPILLTTGFSDRPHTLEPWQVAIPVLAKPYSPLELARGIRAALETRVRT